MGAQLVKRGEDHLPEALEIKRREEKGWRARPLGGETQKDTLPLYSLDNLPNPHEKRRWVS